MFEQETNLSWRITLAVSIYSDTRRISREEARRERKRERGEGTKALPSSSFSPVAPVTFTRAPIAAIHPQRVTANESATVTHLKRGNSDFSPEVAGRWKRYWETWVFAPVTGIVRGRPKANQSRKSEKGGCG